MSRGPEGVCIQPSEEPGFGWDFEAETSMAANSPPMPPVEDVRVPAQTPFFSKAEATALRPFQGSR